MLQFRGRALKLCLSTTGKVGLVPATLRTGGIITCQQYLNRRWNSGIHLESSEKSLLSDSNTSNTAGSNILSENQAPEVSGNEAIPTSNSNSTFSTTAHSVPKDSLSNCAFPQNQTEAQQESSSPPRQIDTNIDTNISINNTNTNTSTSTSTNAGINAESNTISDYNTSIIDNTTTTTSPISRIYSSSSPSLSKTRGKKLPPPPQEYIILGARSSRVIPRQKPQTKSKIPRNIKVDDLDEQRKQLLVFTSDVSIDTALANIDRMKPSLSTLSPKRFDQLMIDLKRGFAVPQLRAYIRSKSDSTLRSSGNKSQLISTILKDLWRVSASDSISESSDVIIERTFQLTRREMFIIVSQNGRLPRSWTKSGASIVILGDEQKIIIRATADTCNWIMASLHKTLQSIEDVDIDFSCLEPFAAIDDVPLGQIQRLSDTYLSYQKSDKTLVASSKSRDQVDHAKRLIVYSTGFMPRSSSSYIYASDSKATPRSMSRIIDDDALSWNERSRLWNRWKKVRSKQELSSYETSREVLSRKQSITIAHGKVNKKIPESEQVDSSLEETILNRLITPLSDKKLSADNQLTFTATFGYLLHDLSDITTLSSPSTVTQRTFLSNSPFVFQRCSELPLYHLETDHDPSVPPPRPKPSPERDIASSDSAWNKLLTSAKLLSDSVPSSSEDNLSPSEDRQGLLEDDGMRLIQIKFIPSPFHVKDLKKLQNLPPIEMWFELKDNSDECDFESLRLVSAEKEVNTYLSLPDFETDIKFSATSAQFLDHTEQEGIKNFTSVAQLSISGSKRIHVPNELKLKLSGSEEEVTYLYQSMCYRRQIDLGFKGHILQLSSLESGGFGGRKIEANLVLDFPDGGENIDKSEIKSFIRDTMEFCQSLRRQSIHL